MLAVYRRMSFDPLIMLAVYRRMPFDPLITLTVNKPLLCVCDFRYFATGSADAICSLWDVSELVCIQTFSRLE